MCYHFLSYLPTILIPSLFEPTLSPRQGVNNCSVPVFQGVSTLLEMMVNCPECLTPEQVQLIAKNVENLTLAENSTTIPKPIPKPKLIKRQNPNTFHKE